MIDLQLTAAAIFRFELDEAERCAQSALAICTQLGLTKTRAVVLVFLGEVYALRRDRAGMDRFLALAQAAEPGDAGDRRQRAGRRAGDAGLAHRRHCRWRSIACAVESPMLDTLPQQGPAPYRAL